MRNESGEFELVLGNRQLLSGFFVVVILFGVFFAMGYIVGRSSAPASQLAEAAAPTPGASPKPQAMAPAEVESPAMEFPPRPADPAREEPAPPVATQPVMATAAREPPAAEPPARPARVDPGPQPGKTYLQVHAIRRPEAEAVAETLRRKGFPVVLRPGPSDLIRVLVGPYSDAASLGKAKADLEDSGFRPFAQR